MQAIHSNAWRGLLLILLAAGCHPLSPAKESAPIEATTVADRSLEDALATLENLSLTVVSGDFRGPLAEAIPRLAQSRVAFVGETHTQYEHHLVQLALLRALHRQNPRLALGVEWFQQDLQHPVDAYLAGRLTEAEMLRQTEYYERWRYDYRLYRPIIEYARRHQIPILALNAPVSITRQVGNGGLESLSPSDRAQLPEHMDSTDPTYRERLRSAYELHPGSEQPFERFLSVQMVWDESMAANAARFLRSKPQHHLLILAGIGHAGFRSGIPNRLLRRLPVSTVTVVTVNELPAAAPESGSADMIVVSPPLQLAPSGKLGVLISSREDRVVVSEVLPDSGAYRAGIRKHDRILTLDGRAIRSFADLKLALMDKQPGGAVAVEVRTDADSPRHLQVVLQ